MVESDLNDDFEDANKTGKNKFKKYIYIKSLHIFLFINHYFKIL